jgi:hypothetical protein
MANGKGILSKIPSAQSVISLIRQRVNLQQDKERLLLEAQEIKEQSELAENKEELQKAIDATAAMLKKNDQREQQIKAITARAPFVLLRNLYSKKTPKTDAINYRKLEMLKKLEDVVDDDLVWAAAGINVEEFINKAREEDVGETFYWLIQNGVTRGNRIRTQISAINSDVQLGPLAANLPAMIEDIERELGGTSDNLDAFLSKLGILKEEIQLYWQDANGERADKRLFVELILSNLGQIQDSQDEIDLKQQDIDGKNQVLKDLEEEVHTKETEKNALSEQSSAITMDVTKATASLTAVQEQRKKEEEAISKLREEKINLSAENKATRGVIDTLIQIQKNMEHSIKEGKPISQPSQENAPQALEQKAPEPIKTINGVKLQCSKCHREWIYKGDGIYKRGGRAMCPNNQCKNMIPLPYVEKKKKGG